MIKIIITENDPEYRGHTEFKKGVTGYITKATQKETEYMLKEGHVKNMTRIRFAARQLGYEGREPIFCWVPDELFEVVK
jgi:hypothetical protein